MLKNSLVMSLLWKKKGLIFKTQSQWDWSQTHTTLPTPFPLGSGKTRIFYTSRDGNQRSRISFIDVDENDFGKVIYTHNAPVLSLGAMGCLDDLGLTSSQGIIINGRFYFFYNGYNVGTTARYRVAIGLATSNDFGLTMNRFSEGPVMDRSYSDPCGCATPFVLHENGLYRMWYSSFIKWEIIEGDPEPLYRIAYAESKDGIHFSPMNIVCIDLKGDEGGIVRPTVVKINNRYHMWFSVRKNSGYRDAIEKSYRIGYAHSNDGISWERADELAGLDVSPEGWDSEMVAYPFVFIQKEKVRMLYNGNGFGKSGFGYAEMDIRELDKI